MKKISLLITILCALPALAQSTFESVLNSIEENNLTLAAAKEASKARKIENKTGLTPSDPEVEFGYMWRNLEGGNKKEVTVTQGFDFPTVYSQRNKLANMMNSSEDIEVKAARMNVLLEAKKVCIDLVYHNAMLALYQRQLANIQQIEQAMETMDKAGEVNILDRNKALLNVATMQSEVDAILLDKAQLLKELARLNGGNELTFDTAEFDEINLPANYDDWYAGALAQNPNIQYLRSLVEVKSREITLSKHEWLPKLSVGYSGEFIGNERTQGVVVGVSIPLWENKNKIKKARAEALAAEYSQSDAELNLQNSLQNLFNSVKTLKSSAESICKALKSCNNEELLYKAYTSREISLLDYLHEVEYYINIKNKLLQTQVEMNKSYAELTAHTL